VKCLWDFSGCIKGSLQLGGQVDDFQLASKRKNCVPKEFLWYGSKKQMVLAMMGEVL
jgi:hypothetical protein